MIRRIGPVGRRLSQAVVDGGRLVTSGQVADAPEGLSTRAQTEEVLRKIDGLLAEVGARRADVVSATVYLADMADLGGMNAAWDAWVDPAALPARTTIQTPMTRPEWRVAIAVTARVPATSVEPE